MSTVAICQVLAARYTDDVYPEPNTGCWIWAGNQQWRIARKRQEVAA